MKIDRQLNLVIPIDRDDGTVAYVYAAPVGGDVFETNYLVMAKAFAKIFGEGLGVIAGPRVAALTLRAVAQDSKADVGPLFAEMHRLANVLVPGASGYDTIPYHEAITTDLLDRRDQAEVDNALAFFTVVCAMHRKPMAASLMSSAVDLWGGQMSSLPLTEFKTSLKTSTTDDSTGETEKVLSIPH